MSLGLEGAVRRGRVFLSVCAFETMGGRAEFNALTKSCFVPELELSVLAWLLDETEFLVLPSTCRSPDPVP